MMRLGEERLQHHPMGSLLKKSRGFSQDRVQPYESIMT